MILVYGIPNCDKVKKCLQDLKAEQTPHQFINFKMNPPTEDLLQLWTKAFGELPVNKRGTTFKKFKETYEKANESQKMKLLIENPSMLIRPILMKKNTVLFTDK